MASLLIEIQELEEKLAQLKLEQAKASSGKTKTDTSGRDKTRLTKGNDENLMLGGSKIGGVFTGDKTFLDTRLKKYELIREKEMTRLSTKTKRPMVVTMPDGKQIEGITWETTPMDIVKGVSNSLAKIAIIAKVEYTGDRVDTDDLTVAGHGDFGETAESDMKKSKAELWDLVRPFEGDCNLEILTFESEEAKMVLWHSSAHILGQAMEREFGAKLTIGPPIEGGYYYDSFVGDQVCTEKEWYPKLEKKTKEITKEKQAFERLLVSKDDLLDLFCDNPFKLAIIKTKIPDGSASTVYRNGNFIDLCMGPHAPSTALSKASTVSKHSATYWCGKETGDTLQRVYGVAFADCKECKANVAMKRWVKEMEMKKQGDHRRVGPNQGLFFMHDLTPGSAFFLTHGARVYNTLVNFIKAEYWKRGYEEVMTPNIFSTDLWKISGHYQKYQDDMFLFNTNDNVEFAMKPMNCPGHCLMFRHLQGKLSHNRLPLRMADFGVLHRNERSGALGGLTRVRRFQQDDAHIFCRPDQVRNEVVGALNFMRDIYKIFGMSFSLMRSTRPDSAVGADTPEGLALWDSAEQALTDALNEFAGEDWKDDVGGGAFYGYLKTEVPELLSTISNFASTIVSSTTEMYNAVCNHLRPTPKKSHYTFNTRDVSNVFQGMLMVNRKRLWDTSQTPLAELFDESKTEKIQKTKDTSKSGSSDFPVEQVARTVLRLWLHESCRVIYDRLIDEQDQLWFSNVCQSITEKQFPQRNCFKEITSNSNPGNDKNQAKDYLEGIMFASLTGADDDGEYCEHLAYTEGDVNSLSDELTTQLEEFKVMGSSSSEENGTAVTDLVFFRDAVAHVARLTRILLQPRGNALLVGVGGSGRKSLARLAAFMSGSIIKTIEVTSQYNTTEWREDIKINLMAAGLERKPVVFMLDDTQVVMESFLEDINSILTSGEVLNIYEQEDIEKIVSESKANAEAAAGGTTLGREEILKYFRNKVG